MASFIDINGETQQVTLDASIYRQAADSKLSVEQLINRTHPTKAGEATAFQQMCASEGLIAGRNSDFGIRPSSLDAILNGTKIEAGVITRESAPASRILFPAFTMSAIENKLRANDYGVVSQFNQMAAVVDTINDDRFERPILDFSKPEAGRMRAVAQLSEPASLLSITASDKAWRITGKSIGMEISDQALRSTTLDLVTLAMTRQYETEMVEEVEGYITSFLNGDADVDMAALATVSGAVSTAESLDSTLSANGTLSQTAWVKWLYANSRKRTINYVITDLAGALAIENRSGRPTVQTDNATSPRIDTGMSVVNPMWPDQVKVFITNDPLWPSNTLVGFDSKYGYSVVNSSVLAYEAAEAYAMRRSTKYRIDRGMIAYRLFDEAWSVLTLTAS
jgi:hypothetical protein